MRTTYTYDHYYRYEELTDILTKYAADYPGYCRLGSIGTTSEGRSVWMMELTDLSSGGFEEKPGFALDGNVHAGEVTGSMCCMYFLDYLLTNRSEKDVAWLLEHYTVYCVPRITPDGSEHYLTTPEMLRSVNKLFPFDELQPGVQPEDLDGDGVIRQMRVKNPNGAFKKWEEDPRVMVKRNPDDTEGDFYDVYSEGKILDFEAEEEIKSAPDKFGNDFNRNFAGFWGVGGRGGAYGLSNPETRAFADFLYAHPNICTCLNFHTSGGMYIYPPAYKSAKKAEAEDMTRYRELGRICTQETGYEFVNLHDEFLGPMIAPVGGSIDDFAHYVLGIVSFTCECWDLDARCGYPAKFPRLAPRSDEDQAKLQSERIKWLEQNNRGEGYSDWTPFVHPQLGEVEIGGLDPKTTIQNPPSQYLLQEVEKHTRFMLREMKLLPRLELEQIKAEKLGDCYEIRAKISNRGYFPTYMTAESKNIGNAKPLRVRLEGAEVIRGEKEEIGHLSGFSGAASLGYGLGGTTNNHAPSTQTLRFLVKGEPGTKVSVFVEAPRAGVVSVEICLA